MSGRPADPISRRSARRGGAEVTRRGSLLAAEISRLLARRLVRALVLLAVVGFAVGVGATFTQFAKPSAAGLAEATRLMRQAMADADRNRAECAKQVPTGQTVDSYCGPPSSEQPFSPQDFISKPPFDLSQYATSGALAVAAGAAALAFLVGASYVGAEWSTRSMVALLFWEPRRFRVMLTKIGVTVGFAVLIGILAQLLWTGAAVLLARTRGTDRVPAQFWQHLVELHARSVAFTVLAALFGFGLANLGRSTGAALGLGFVYFAVLETAVRLVWSAGQQFLVSVAAAGLLVKGGTRVFLDQSFVDERGVFQQGRTLAIGNGRAGLTLGLYCGLVLAAGIWAFRRRDLQ